MQTQQTETKDKKGADAPVQSAPFFDPSKDFVAKTPIPVNPGEASAIPVLAVYRSNVQGKTAVEVYFALIGKNGCLFDHSGAQPRPTQCAVVRNTYWLSGTRNDANALQVLAATQHAMSFVEPIEALTEEFMKGWCERMTSSWRPVTLLLETDPNSVDGRYVRVRHVNPLRPLTEAYTKVLKDTGVLVQAKNRAIETAQKVAEATGSSGATIDTADDIPF